jgi:hypothetical protein
LNEPEKDGGTEGNADRRDPVVAVLGGEAFSAKFGAGSFSVLRDAFATYASRGSAHWGGRRSERKYERTLNDDIQPIRLLHPTNRFAESIDSLQDEDFGPRPSEVRDGVEEGHVRSTDERVGDLSVEGGDADKLDGAASVRG